MWWRALNLQPQQFTIKFHDVDDEMKNIKIENARDSLFLLLHIFKIEAKHYFENLYCTPE